MQTHYDILGAGPGASESELEAAYHRRAHLLHPDHHTGAPADVRAEAEKWMRELNASWAVLRSPYLRSQYDALLQRANARIPDRASHGPPATPVPAPAPAATAPSRKRQAWGQVAVISLIAATSLTTLVLLLSVALGPG